MSLNTVDVSTLTVAGTSIGLSSASPTKAVSFALGARQALIVVEDAPVYMRSDGDAATSADILLNVGDAVPMLGDNMNQVLDNLRFIRKTTTSATLKIIWYNREAVLTERIIRGAVRLVTATGDSVFDDTADAIRSMPQRFDMILKPFGKGSLTTDGVQYSAEVGSIGDTYTAIEAATINQPLGYTLEEIEFALTVAIKSSSTAESVLWKMQASDNGTDWQDLIAEQTRAASAAAYADVSASGRFAPTTNFLGTSTTFQVRAVVKSGAAGGETATGKMKNSSYIICKYRRS